MNGRALGYFLGLFLPSAALVAGGAVVVHRAQVARQVEAIELRETLDTQRGARELREFIADTAHDLLFVRNLPSMRAALDDDTPATVRALESMFAGAIESRGNVDRVRWIDETGVERVRVSATGSGTEATPPAALQDKRHRYFVRDIEALADGQIYVSPMDLSRDHDVLERPLKPVVRVGTPLVESDGRRRGMLLVNYRVEPLLAAFDASTRSQHGESMLVDGRGHWLHVPRNGDRQILLDAADSFAMREPAAWARMARQATGQFEDAAGIWTFETVRPLETAARSAHTPQVGASRTASSAAHDWKVVSFVPAAEVAAVLRPTTWVVAGGAALLLLLSAVVGGLIARAWERRETADLARARRNARESEAALRLVLQGNPNAILVFDRDGAVFEANPQAARVFGYSPEELRRQRVETFVPEAVRGMHLRRREGYANGHKGRPMEQEQNLTARRKDGSEFPVEISLAPLSLAGTPYVVATVVDISRRRQAEAQVRELNATLERRVEQRTEELRRAEASLRLILESNASGLFGVDVAGHIAFANVAACRMLGYARDELIGRAAGTLSASQGPGRGLAARLEHTLRAGTGAAVDDEAYLRADGGELPVSYSTHPMRQDGQIVGAVVSFMDATERRALDAAREVALREAERLAQARSDFLANMSHEIRTPLNGVLGLAQVAHREAGDPATRATFARILEAGRTLLGVVDNVLDFSRIEAGKVQVEAIVADPAALMTEAVAAIRPVADTKGIAVRFEQAPSAPVRCVTDPTRVKQVLLNLLANAVKFTERGEVVLAFDRVGNELRFVVRDTGIGVSAEQAERIFTAFEQADTSTTRRFGGTGLGLAICKRIVELLGGRIAVRSEVGAGSEFTVFLPFVEPAPGTDTGGGSATQDTSASATRSVQRLAGLRILLAEDNEVNQAVVLAMLRREGPEIVTVADGRQAVDRVRREGPGTFDLVLMDIQMPGMDGYQATRLVHEVDPGLPVVGQTAHVLHEAIEQCLAAGMVAHVPKPIDRRELVATIMRHARLRDQEPDANSARST